MKNMWFHVADNTTLDCPMVTYKYNRDTYVGEKRLYWIVSFVGLIVSFCVVIFCRNSVLQTIAGSFMGGILSLIVWLFTIRQQDKMNYEIANIDLHIMHIDEHLDFQNSKAKFINPEEDELVQADSESVVLRFMHLMQLVINIMSDKYIDSSVLMLKTGEDECTLQEYIDYCEEICQNHFLDIAKDEEKWSKTIAWNNYIIDWKLGELKKKLIRYKTYVLCGNAPTDYIEKK